jgi:hypothetical protein
MHEFTNILDGDLWRSPIEEIIYGSQDLQIDAAII